MILPFTMTFAGSVPVICCLIFYLADRQSFHAILAMHLLRISIFFYLIPIQLLYHVLPASIVPFKPVFSLPKDEHILVDFRNKLQVQLNQGALLIPYWLIALVLIGTFLALIFFCYEMCKYHKASRMYSSVPFTNSEEPLYADVSSPFTIGLWHTRIILPEYQKSMDTESFLYQHEIFHARHHDTFFKFLCLIVLCLHWFNPVAWFLLPFYSFVSECASDQYVTKQLSSNEKRAYATSLIQYATEKEPLPLVWQSNFSQSKSLLKRRITLVMKRSEKKRLHMPLFALLLTLSIVLGSATVWGYTPLQTVDSDECPEPGVELTEYLIESDEDLAYWDPYYALDFSTLDEGIIADDNITVYPFPETNEELRKTCKHTFKQTKSTRHIKNADGSCVINVYSIKVCSKCGYQTGKKLITSTTSPKCTHK